MVCRFVKPHYVGPMCAICFTGFQAIPVAAASARAWWVKRTTADTAESLVCSGPESFDHEEPQRGEEHTEADDAPCRVEGELAPVGGGERHMFHP